MGEGHEDWRSPSFQAMGRARDMRKQLESKSWLVRWLSFSTKSEIRRIFTVYTEQGISNKVEIGGTGLEPKTTTA